MPELSGAVNPDRPPVLVRAAVVILVVVAFIEFVLCVSPPPVAADRFRG